MSALTSNLAEFVMKPTLVIIVLLAVHFALRRASAATRHLTLTLALVSLLVLPFLTLSLPTWDLEVLPASATPAAASGTPLSARLLEDLGPSGIVSAAVPQRAAALPTSGGSKMTPQVTAASVGTALVVIWLLGSVLFLAKIVAGLLRMQWIVRRGETLDDPALRELLDDCRAALQLRARPRLVASERVGVPLVWSWLRPALIVPREFLGWTVERKRAVLLHELAHLKRSDWPVLLLGRVVASLYWFHPLVWFLERCAKREAEQACDDLVVNCGTKPSDYASHLLSIARGARETPGSAMAALAIVRQSHLNSRVRSILNPLLRRGAPSRRTATALSIALVIALLPFAGVQLAQQAHADEPDFDGDQKVFLAQHSKMKTRKQLHSRDHGESGSAGVRSFELGYKLHGEGRYHEAIEAFEQAIALDARTATAMYNIGCCHALLGEADSAMSWLEQARDAGVDDPELLTSDSDFDPIRSEAAFQSFIDEAFEAAGIERRGDEHYPYRTTLEWFEKLQSSESTDGKAWYKVGTRLIGFGELDRSIEALDSAVEHLGERNDAAMYNLACALSLNGSTRSALQWLDRAVAAGFDQHELILTDADLNPLRDEREFKRIAETSELLSLGSFPRREWDESTYSVDRWAPAIQRYEEFVGDHSASGRGWFNLGYALHHSKRFEEALAAFTEARELSYRLSTTTYNLACGNAMLGRTDAALTLLGQAVDLGGIGRGQVEHDSDLDSLRSDPRFETLLETLEDEEFRYKMKHMKQMKHLYKLKQEEKAKARQLHYES